MSEIQNQKLQNAFRKNVDRLGATCAEFPWANEQAYAWWLAQTYYYVRHTTCFLGLVASRFSWQQRDRQYHVLGHLRDEMSHDQIALEDLKALGRSIDEFPELAETAAFYQSQYYFIEHENPIAHIGYSLCLEGLAAKKGMQFYNVVRAAHGEKASRFLHLHCLVDQDHFEHGLEEIATVTDAEAEIIIRNLEQSVTMYSLMLKHIEGIIHLSIPEQRDLAI
jgi:hypothetical protein